jgi:hypothetical protein
MKALIRGVSANTSHSITEETFLRCQAFADASVGSNAPKYAKRNQFNVEKISQDIRTGKLGEEIVYQALVSQFPKLSKPDHAIYTGKQKSWAPDLSDPESGIVIGVKTQEIKSETKYGRSWVFQYRAGKAYDVDKGIFGDKDDKHYVAFVSINSEKRIGELRGIVRVSWLHEKNLFKPMKLQHLQSNKMAVYYSDLATYGKQLWQL